MKLFGGMDKEKVEESIKMMRNDEQALRLMNEDKEALFSIIMSNPTNSGLLFQMTYDKNIKDMERWVDVVRAAADPQSALIAMVEHTIVLTRAWLAVWMEAVNRHVTKEHQLTLELFDALSTRNETKIGELRNKLKEMETRQPTKEQLEVVDALLNAFKEQGKDFLDGNK